MTEPTTGPETDETDDRDAIDGSTQALIDDLAGEGEHVDDGQFQLDPSRALAKLRDYQLADPHSYLALVLEAAYVASGGEARVEITIGQATTIEFTGLALDASSLEQVFDALFRSAKSEDPAARARARTLRLLGLALNGALALDPRRVRLEVTGADSWVNAIELDGTRKLQTKQRIRTSTPGRTRFVLETRGLGLLRATHEASLVRTRCRHSTLTIYVDGVMLSEGPRAALSARELGPCPELPVMLDGARIGVAGFSRDVGQDRALIYTRGVLAEELSLDGAAGFVAVVEVDLAKDLSQARIVRGPEFEAVRAAILAVHAQAEPPDFPLDENQRRIKPGPTETQPALPMIIGFGITLLAAAFILEPSPGRPRDPGQRSAAPPAPLPVPRLTPPFLAGPPRSPQAEAVTELMRGVTTVAVRDSAPIELTTTAPAFPVALARADERVVVAASEWGAGRVVAVASGDMFGRFELAAPETQQFLTNAARWTSEAEIGGLVVACLAREPCRALAERGAVTQVLYETSWASKLDKIQVLILDTHALGSQGAEVAVPRFVSAGGGLIVTGSSADLAGAELLHDAGIYLRRDQPRPPLPSVRVKPAP